MANISIKELPAQVHEHLKVAARERGQSLNSYILYLLQASMEERQRRQRMRETREGYRRFLRTVPQMQDDSTALLREDRRRGHR